jgi:hypothetical protein
MIILPTFLGALSAPEPGPVNTVAPVVTGSTPIGSTLTTTNGTWTSPSSITYSYQWKSNAANVGANQNTYVTVSGDYGHTITCVVTAANDGGRSASTSNGIVVTADAPVNTVAPAVTGTTAYGSTLTTTNGTWTGTPTITYAYQWKSGSTNVGANQNTYVTVLGDNGASVTCVVTATNVAGSVPATSNGITVAGAPVNSVAPVVTGATLVGSTLTTTDGTWTGGTTIAFSYQWKRNGSTNVGTNQNTYVTVTADIGFAVTCEVTGTNNAGSSTGTSNGITVAAPVLPTTWDFSQTFGGTATFSNGNKSVTCTTENIILGTIGQSGSQKRFFQCSVNVRFQNGSCGLRLSGATTSLAGGLPSDTARRSMFANGTRVGILFNPTTGERTIYNGPTLWDGPSVMSVWVDPSSVFFPAFEIIDHFDTIPTATGYFSNADLDADGLAILAATGAVAWDT